MAEPIYPSANNVSGGFSDAVCIDAGRVYDSCMDRDCLENLRVYFNSQGQAMIQNAVNCRVKSAEVIYVAIDVEPVTFNRGFFSCDLTFFFLIRCDVSCSSHSPQEICGIAFHNKRVILCGSEGAVKTFSSLTEISDSDIPLMPGSNLPRCVVQVVDPVVLDSKICETHRYKCSNTPSMFPKSVLRRIDGEVSFDGSDSLYVTLGLFSVVQLIRNVQMLVPVYDFCIPKKECSAKSDDPCDLFDRIKFPTDEFFPSPDLCKQRNCGEE